jgi:trehalose 6-phosphate synthase
MENQRRQNGMKLEQLCKDGLSQRSIIIAANRGPFEYYSTEDGRLQVRRSGGWMMSILNNLAQYKEFCWVTGAMGEGDRKAIERAEGDHFKAPVLGRDVYLRFVSTPRNMYHKYYSVFCNPLLWFLQHNLWNASYTPNIDKTVYDAWEGGYLPVNKAFAEAVVAEAKKNYDSSIVMIHDYHLYMAPQYIRQALPNIVIQHFTHVPWPSADGWEVLPKTMRRSIHSSLCQANIVGLQNKRFIQNFLQCCDCFLEGAQVDYKNQTVFYDGHLTHVKSYPTSVDATNLQKLNSSYRVQEYDKKLSPFCEQQVIVRVDRAEPSKNIVRGFRAYELMLEHHPEMKGKVTFLAFLVPIRTHVKQFQRYMDEVRGMVETINSNHGTAEWQPIHLFCENNYAQALAALRQYNVLLVNSISDGMPMVAKEGPLVNQRNGVLVLSEGLGACEQLGQCALLVAPTDIEGTTQALYTALTMSDEERTQRTNQLKRIIAEEDVTHWLCCQLEDLVRVDKQVAVTRV